MSQNALNPPEGQTPISDLYEFIDRGILSKTGRIKYRQMLQSQIRQARADAYADCGSKGGAGTVVRAYANKCAYGLQEGQENG